MEGRDRRKLADGRNETSQGDDPTLFLAYANAEE